MLMLNKEQIKEGQNYLNRTSPNIREKSRLYSLGSDPTRLKIFFLLKKYKELCVTDFAEILDVSLSAVSHQMSLLERANLVVKTRVGQMVCYSLYKENKELINLLVYFPKII